MAALTQLAFVTDTDRGDISYNYRIERIEEGVVSEKSKAHHKSVIITAIEEDILFDVAFKPDLDSPTRGFLLAKGESQKVGILGGMVIVVKPSGTDIKA